MHEMIHAENDSGMVYGKEEMGLLRLSVFLPLIEGEAEQNKFEQLYEEYAGQLLHRAKQLLQDEMLAEEAASRTFVYIAKNMDKVEQAVSSRTQALLMLVLKHTAIDLARKRKRDYQHWADWSAMDNVEANERTDAIADAPLDEALERLPWPYQQVILLKYANGYNNREIAQLLNYTVSKVEKLLSRGKRQLRQLLEEVRQQ